MKVLGVTGGSGTGKTVVCRILKEQGVNISDDPNIAFIGELSLDGSLRRVNGVLPLVLGLKESGIKTVFKLLPPSYHDYTLLIIFQVPYIYLLILKP